MIEAIIRWSVGNRFFVLLATALLVGMGLYSVKNTPMDAIPDLSDVHVIIKTSFPGHAPQVVEDQVTYPLTTAMLSVPGAATVRGFSFFGDSYVYVIFDEGTDLYWARSRVLEYLSQVAPSLPEAARPQLGPDATGVGWVYIRPGRSQRAARYQPVALAAGLVPEVRAANSARCGGGGDDRWHGASIPGGR